MLSSPVHFPRLPLLALGGALLLSSAACNKTSDTAGGDDSAAAYVAPLFCDLDGDFWGTSAYDAATCVNTDGSAGQAVTLAGDCKDDDASIHPYADELCDELDQDCDGAVDEDAVDLNTFYVDADGDGYGIKDQSIESCARRAPDGYAGDYGDCDDTDSYVSPGRSERCATDYDDDCDGNINEDSSSDAVTYYVDFDGDGYGSDSAVMTACEAPKGAALVGGDCDDLRGGVNPGATEICGNGIDDDCDGDIDEDC